MFDSLTLTQVVAIIYILMMGGFAVITAWIMGEFKHIKHAIAVILAANPKLAQEVANFEKKEENNAVIQE